MAGGKVPLVDCVGLGIRSQPALFPKKRAFKQSLPL